jgi:hypothetical protein
MIGLSLTMAKYSHIGDVLLALIGTSFELSNSRGALLTTPSLAATEMLTDGAGDSMIK